MRHPYWFAPLCVFLLFVSNVDGFAAVQAPNSDAAVHGTTIFHEKGCAQCHGEDLGGTAKGPNLTGVGRRLTQMQIQHQIQEGGENMPAFGDALDESELKSLTLFLHKQRKRSKAK